MKKPICNAAILICFVLLNSTLSHAWGFYAHKQINRLAIYTLPPELFGFYKLNIDYITDNAVNADKRRYSVPEEAVRHYLDADHYEFSFPIDSIPPYWKDAVAKYSEDTLQTYGIVPWYLQIMKFRLVEAFKNKDVSKILFLSADMGHYIGDLHVPLHSTENYDGQFTDQSGIHGLWESRLPELYSHNYDFFVGRAALLPDFSTDIWRAFGESFAAKDSVFNLEKEATLKIGESEKYSIETKNNLPSKQYSEKFCNYYHTQLNGMVERRMQQSILLVGSVWLSAWAEAGQPILEGMEPLVLTDQEKKERIAEEINYLKGKILGRDEAK